MDTSLLAAPDKYLGPQHWFLGAAAVWCFYMGVGEIWSRLMIDVEGTIVSSETTSGNRQVTRYVLRGADGTERHYTAGSTDASLPRRLSENTQIVKRRLELSWHRNGVTVDDFPLTFYLIICGIGAALVSWSVMQWRLNRPHRSPSESTIHA